MVRIKCVKAFDIYSTLAALKEIESKLSIYVSSYTHNTMARSQHGKYSSNKSAHLVSKLRRHGVAVAKPGQGGV